MALMRIYFEILNLFPMPIQFVVFLFVTSVFIYLCLRLVKYLLVLLGKIGMKLAEWLTRLLLLPEYLFTSLLRLIRINYIPGAGFYDDVMEAIGRFLYKAFEKITLVEKKNIPYPIGWILLFMALSVGAWFLALAPEMRGTLTSLYIARFFTWYYSLQYQALSYLG